MQQTAKPPFPGELTVGFARAAAAADCKPPFPGELLVGFPGEPKAPTAVLKAPTAALTGVLLAVASGMEKRGGNKETRRLLVFPIGWEQLELKVTPYVSFCQLLLLENWVAVLCLDQVRMVHVLLLHF
jgi:hypothetical protein